VRVDEVVADHEGPVMAESNSMKVMQDEEPREEEPGAPEWGRDPCIEVVIIPWRRIISHHGWPLVVIVILDYGGTIWTVILRWLVFGILTGSLSGHDR